VYRERFLFILIVIGLLHLFILIFLNWKPNHPPPLQTIAVTLGTDPSIKLPTMTELHVPQTHVKNAPLHHSSTPLQKKRTKILRKIEREKIVTKQKLDNVIERKQNKKTQHQINKIVVKQKINPSKQLNKASEHSLKLAKTDVRALLQKDLMKNAPLNAHEQSALMQYQTLILQAIAQQWIIPPKIDQRLEATLLVHLDRDGKVLSVEIKKSSQNALLDRSAQLAVYQASPLPMPFEANLIERFQTLELTVRPQEIKRVE
jgi:colicin import membrane protein